MLPAVLNVAIDSQRSLKPKTADVTVLEDLEEGCISFKAHKSRKPEYVMAEIPVLGEGEIDTLRLYLPLTKQADLNRDPDSLTNVAFEFKYEKMGGDIVISESTRRKLVAAAFERIPKLD